MAIRDIFKFSRKTFLNPSGWIDLDWLVGQTRLTRDVLKTVFTVAKPDRQETFEEAMQRQGLTDADVASAIKRYRLYALFFFSFGLVAFSYALFLLFHHGAFLGCLLGFATVALCGAQAFRYDFWALQMRKRRLGMTFVEWKQYWLSSKGPST